MEKKQIPANASPKQTDKPIEKEPIPTVPVQEGPSNSAQPGRGEDVVPIASMTEFLRMINLNVDWAAAITKLGLTMKKPVIPEVTIPAPTSTAPHIVETREESLLPNETLKSNPTSPNVGEPSKVPLDVCHLSYYIPPVKISDEEWETETVMGDKGMTMKDGNEGEKGGMGEKGETEDKGGVEESVDEEVKERGVENMGGTEGEMAEGTETTKGETEEGLGSGQGEAELERCLIDDEFVDILRGVQDGTIDKDSGYRRIYRDCRENLKVILERTNEKGILLTYREMDGVLRAMEAEEKEKKRAKEVSGAENLKETIEVVPKSGEKAVEENQREAPRGQKNKKRSLVLKEAKKESKCTSQRL